MRLFSLDTPGIFDVITDQFYIILVLRVQLVRASRSPFALLPPPTMKEIVKKIPEIVSRFPRRYPPNRKNIHSMEDD